MTVTASWSAEGDELTIAVEGRFDFSVHQAFRRAYEEAPDTPRSYIVDLARATYLDSSALGMLLLLRDHAGGDNADISIVNSNEEILKVLTVSNFDQLFKLS